MGRRVLECGVEWKEGEGSLCGGSRPPPLFLKTPPPTRPPTTPPPQPMTGGPGRRRMGILVRLPGGARELRGG